MSKDDLGDRMKLYEGMECDRRFMPRLPIVARIDGRSFHSFTKGMDRPYDKTMVRFMIETAQYLAEHTNANIAYTQSDEISLAWFVEPPSQIWFDGRIAKMTSQLAAQATLFFNRLLEIEVMKDSFKWLFYYNRMPTFDARVWQVPNKVEAANVFVWREQDAVKNSITMAASHYYSHKELHGKNGAEKQEMLFQKGVNWNDYPKFFKRGTYIQRKTTYRPFTPQEIELLPPKHEARQNPSLMVERSEYTVIDMPPILKIKNRTEVIFDGATPIVGDIHELTKP